jgi:nitroimidazol reductase NimA-like FMN-containing flavoprotein (pyridoxamine 5'-phosphate oxidase superfamily)
MKSYPQKPPFSHDELIAFLDEAPIARLCSMNLDGTILITAVYFKYDDGDILIGTNEMSRKVRNIKHNQNVSVLIDNQTRPWKGVLIYGEAFLDHEDVIPKRIAIFERYMATEDARKGVSDLAQQFTPVIIRIKPKRMTSYDYSKAGFIQSKPELTG